MDLNVCNDYSQKHLTKNTRLNLIQTLSNYIRQSTKEDCHQHVIAASIGFPETTIMKVMVLLTRGQHSLQVLVTAQWMTLLSIGSKLTVLCCLVNR